jgi:glucose/mannose transport system substrate-binding protein
MFAIGRKFAMASARLRSSFTAAFSVPLMSIACGTVDNSVASDNSGQIEIATWWSSVGERDALNASLEIHKQKYPNVTVVDLYETYGDGARMAFAQKLQDGNPSDTFQANIGEDLMHWVKTNGIDASESPVGPIDSYVSKAAFYEKLVEPVTVGPDSVDQATVNHVMYAVPMNVHRINSLFYSKAVFTKYQIKEPFEGMTLGDFNDICAQLKSVGKIPLALGNKFSWTLPELVFESILPGIAGAEFYQKFWRGQADPGDSRVKDAINEALLLRCGPNRASACDASAGYFNVNNAVNDKTDDAGVGDADAIDWPDALDMVLSGTAAMSAIGDWAKGYFQSNHWVADQDFGVVQFPGDHNVFIYTADSFPLLIKDAPSRGLAAQLLQTFASVESQVAFNHYKGSIPARSDIDLNQYPNSFDAMNRHTYELFNATNTELGLAMSGLLPNGLLIDLYTTLRDSLDAGTDALILTYLQKNYSSLKH